MDTHETQSVGVCMVRDVSRQVYVGNPTRNESDGIGGDTHEGGNVRVRQVFPYDSHLVECLGISSALKRGGKRDQNTPS